MKLCTEVASFYLYFVSSCEYIVGLTYLFKLCNLGSNNWFYLIYLLFFIWYMHFSPHCTEIKAWVLEFRHRHPFKWAFLVV
jgi:hypothetical protein